MSRPLVIAAAQTGSFGAGGRERIVASAHRLLDEAAGQGVGLLTFSEVFLGPFFPNRLEQDFDRHFMDESDPVIAGLVARAAQHRIALILPIAERTPQGYFNTALVFEGDGSKVGRYRKTHIPAYFPEDRPGGTGSYEKFYFAPGGALDVFDVAGVRIGIQICNDRLYPEGSRVLALKGAEVLVMPICYSTYADPDHRESIWEVPLRARAFENGAFVLACNRVGIEGPRHHLGRSVIVDPRGAILGEASRSDEALLVARIDLDAVREARTRFPWWRDRRPELYAPISAAP